MPGGPMLPPRSLFPTRPSEIQPTSDRASRSDALDAVTTSYVSVDLSPLESTFLLVFRRLCRTVGKCNSASRTDLAKAAEHRGIAADAPLLCELSFFFSVLSNIRHG